MPRPLRRATTSSRDSPRPGLEAAGVLESGKKTTHKFDDTAAPAGV